MNRGKEVQEEYLNLRCKVEGRIKELEQKLSPNSAQSSSHVVYKPQSPLHSHHHHCHQPCLHHHCHPTQQPTAKFLYPSNVQFSNSECQVSSNKQSNSKNGSVNELISEALIESLKNQRQINDHIKAINEKIQNISIQQNRSCMSEAFSESVSKKRNKNHHYNNILRPQPDKQRCYSEIKSQSKPSGIRQPKAAVKVTLKKVKSNQKLSENVQSINTKHNKKGSKPKISSRFKSQYFLSFGCPIHSPNKIADKSQSGKQIYLDSQHRNRKHQKNHLIQSFNQQKRARKQLINKISHKAFQEYGRF